MKFAKYTKLCFRIKAILDFNVAWNFQPLSACFDNVIRKIKTQLS